MATTADYRTCRALAHSWQPYEATRRPRNQAGAWLWVLRCERCGTLREDVVDSDGTVLGRNYRHPIDYKAAVDPGESRKDLRRWLVDAEARRTRSRARAHLEVVS